MNSTAENIINTINQTLGDISNNNSNGNNNLGNNNDLNNNNHNIRLGRHTHNHQHGHGFERPQIDAALNATFNLIFNGTLNETKR